MNQARIMPPSNRWRAVGAVAVGLVFLAASIMKLAWVHPFLAFVDVVVAGAFKGAVIPLPLLRDMIVIITLGFEASLGAALILGRHRPNMALSIALGALAAFTGFLLLAARIDPTATCGCFGAWSATDQGSGVWPAIIRNLGLGLLVAWVRWSPHASTDTPPPSGAREGGFSLVEVLVVLAIIGVLLAITLPMLARARSSGKASEALSAQRQYVAALMQFSSEEQGSFPFLGVPGDPEAGTLPNLTWPNGAPSYFRGQSRYWPTLMLDRGIDLSSLPQNEWVSDDRRVLRTYVWLTHAASARPAYWVGPSPPEDRSLFAPTRVDECAFPSAKGVLANVGFIDPQATTWDVAMADGSASTRSTLDPPMVIPDLIRPFNAVEWRVLTTPQGVLGRDY